ncbi:metallophosphoesterase [Paenibacillus sp. N3/727]|uniref:LamG-like jellyroll fold domain-containing protein n=1 Tax=Paenibacillus sp. N3/727 TaxID=2925845 RepID=UPI001F53075C|nr:LamG-like jellyroll fold domain-containing protein [Paenibacillus sp. N3/727]UNK18902.1 metallophosphoesterase [Paenibacillus sp. N3/727]
MKPFRRALAILLSATLIIGIFVDISPATAKSGASEENDSFKVAILPDTQKYARYKNEISMSQTQWIKKNAEQENIVFTSHLGDIVDRVNESYEWQNADEVMQILDKAKLPYGYLAGNHDVLDPSQKDNERDLKNEPFLNYFSADRMKSIPGFGGHSENGFNSYYIFEGAGKKYITLFLDWRASEESLTWAQEVIDKHPDYPVMLFTHQLLNISGDKKKAVMTDHGQYLWDTLIKKNDQIFLTVNGHHHGYAHKVMKNEKGNDVVMMVVDYQSAFHGGNGLMRTLEFDMAKNRIHVESFSPWVMKMPESQRTIFDEEKLVDDFNDFTITMDFEERFSGFQPAIQVDKEVPSIEGTQAHWRFENRTTSEGQAVAGNGTPVVRDLTNQGNDLYRKDAGNASPEDLIWYKGNSQNPQSRSGIRFFGDKTQEKGSYLQTSDNAPLNKQNFENGYTVEAIVKLSPDFQSDKHSWMGILGRLGTGKDAGKMAGDADAPLATMSVSSLREIQWAVYPVNYDSEQTNWSWEMDDNWHHISIVNDRTSTTMYIDGVEVLRNPDTRAYGLTSVDQPWMVGASHYANKLDGVFNGWISEVRLVDRALDKKDFLK